MAYITVSSIAGCFYPAEVGARYNDAKIVSYHKVDYLTGNPANYVVIIKFENNSETFRFLNATDRDNFYNTLPS